MWIFSLAVEKVKLSEWAHFEKGVVQHQNGLIFMLCEQRMLKPHFNGRRPKLLNCFNFRTLIKVLLHIFNNIM